MTELPDLSGLTHEEKDALIQALRAQIQALTAQVQALAARVTELEAKLGTPPKTPGNSSVPPSKGEKPDRPENGKRHGPCPGSLGGGRALAATPDETVVAKPARCAHCRASLGEADHVLHGRRDKTDLPQVAPVVTRVERYAGRCRCCGATTLAPVPKGLEPGTPFGVGIVALAMYLRFVHAISYQWLSRLLGELFGLGISEGALGAVVALAPAHCDGQRLRKRCGKHRSHLFTFLDHPKVPADNNGSKRELRPTATYRKVTGGFRPDWGAGLFAGVRSVIGTKPPANPARFNGSCYMMPDPCDAPRYAAARGQVARLKGYVRAASPTPARVRVSATSCRVPSGSPINAAEPNTPTTGTIRMAVAAVDAGSTRNALNQVR